MSEQSGTDEPTQDDAPSEDEEEQREDPTIPEEDKTPIDKAAEKVSQVLKKSDGSGGP